MADCVTRLNRIRGALLGTAVGDALCRARVQSDGWPASCARVHSFFIILYRIVDMTGRGRLLNVSDRSAAMLERSTLRRDQLS